MGQRVHDDVTWPFLASQSRGMMLNIIPRVLLEPFFPDLDLAGVRVYTDEPADRASRSVGADAFSLGRNIFFRAGRFEPATPKGLALLGHELAHSRQVISGVPSQAVVRREGLEQEAERTEASLLQVFSPSGGQRSEPHALSGSGGGYQYRPLSLEPARPLSVPAQTEGGLRRGREFATSFSGLSGSESTGHPLKAEEGRSAASGPGSMASPSTSADDPEKLTRHILRSLERKIRVEKERRGVDRWVL